MDKAYDWTWRKDWRTGLPCVMTFDRLYREASEICSPELYCRLVEVNMYIQESYFYGLYLQDMFEGNRREVTDRLNRLARIAFVKAYLCERRAGLQPRKPGPAEGFIEARDRAVEAKHRREREFRDEQRWQGFCAIWLAIAGLMENK